MKKIIYFRILPLCLVSLWLVIRVPPAWAQDTGCFIEVYTASSGQDTGQCTSPDAPCKTVEFALQQGQMICRDQGIVTQDGLTMATWLVPPEDEENLLYVILIPLLGFVLSATISFYLTNKPGGRRR